MHYTHMSSSKLDATAGGYLLFVASLCLSTLLAQAQEICPISPSMPASAREPPKLSKTTEHPTTERIYSILKVRPPSQLRLPKLKIWAWRLHGRLLPWLHLGDKIPDVKVNLRVLWNKALTALDPNSPAYEEGNNHQASFTYHMLPPYSRWILKAFRPLFPRWMHANIELRTTYLNQAIQKEVEWIRNGYKEQGPPPPDDDTDPTTSAATTTTRIQVIVLGGGYDARSVRLLYSKLVDFVWELDLPQVVASKQFLLRRLLQSLPILQSTTILDNLQLESIDLNDRMQMEQLWNKRIASALKKVQSHSDPQKEEEVYTIVLMEAVLMYLDEGLPSQILQFLSSALSSNNNNNKASLVFADCFQELKHTTDLKDVGPWLAERGWAVVDWLPKPGATRHMGVARLLAQGPPCPSVNVLDSDGIPSCPPP